MRWGIISTGHIAAKFADALRASESEHVVAAASRDAERAAVFASDYGIARGYGSYEALLADPEVEAVYIGLPNSMHAEWSIKTAQAGKHILAAGQAPSRVLAAAKWAGSGVDETLAGTLEYPGGALAQISCTLSGSGHQQVQIIGTDGSIDIDTAFNLPADQRGRMRVHYGANPARTEDLQFAPVNQYQLEAEGFARLVQAGHDAAGLPDMPLAETLDNMATIEALLRSAQAGHAVEVEP